MKYCRYCGAELLDAAVICPKCGCPVEQIIAPVEVDKPKLAPLALVGFILSIVAGFVSFILLIAASDSASGAFVVGLPPAIAGLVCSIIGLVRVKRNKQRGKGFAIAGIVVGAVICALWLLAFMIAFYYVFIVLLFMFVILGV